MNKPLNFGLGRNVYQNITRPSAAQLFGQQPAAGVGVQAPVSPDIMPLRRAVIEQQMRPRLTPAQQFTAMTPPQAPPPRPDRPKRGLLDGLLPGAGTPEAAGLGAAGQRMLELSGYSKMPISMSQILGEAAKAYTTTRQETAAAQAAAERQRQQDAIAARREELELANIRSQIKQRGKTKANIMNISGVGAVDVSDPSNPKLVVPAKGKSGEKIMSVPGVGLVDVTDSKNPKVVYESQDRARYQNLGGYYLDGRYIGEGTLDKKTGERYLDVEGERQPIPESAIGMTEGMAGRGILTGKQMNELSSGLIETETGLRKYTSYLENIDKAGVGLERLGDQLTSYFKTLLSTNAKIYGLSESELALRIAEGQIQGLLGSSRIETVGGGVMTEQDALRVLKNLGGDITLLQNPEVAKAQISRLFGEKYRSYKNDLQKYNIQVDQFYGGKGYDRKGPLEFDTDLIDPSVLSSLGIQGSEEGEGVEAQTQTTDGNLPPVPEGVDPEVWAAMKDEERALWP